MPSNDFEHASFDEGLPHVHVTDAGPARRCAPGSESSVVVSTSASRGPANVSLIVEDASLLSALTSGNRLAGPMKACAGDARPARALTALEQTPADAMPEPSLLWTPPSSATGEGCFPITLQGAWFIIGAPLIAFWIGRLGAAQDMIILVIIGVLLVGRKSAEMSRYLGKGVIEFKKGIHGLEDEAGVLDQPPAKTKKTVTRRATVRYYNRMNPERVYPLLVMLTGDMVEKVHKKHTDQRASDPFAFEIDAPVEIEPVLPGCDCHPPKILTRIGQADVTLTFRVVPRVMGRVEGAVVSIRQDHVSLAEIELEMKVVKQTWAALCGTATFLLPGLSAVMNHFGLDFQTQQEQGFSVYISVARLLFDRISPFALTAPLGAATALVWQLTRPRTRDVFWDIHTVGGCEKQ